MTRYNILVLLLFAMPVYATEHVENISLPLECVDIIASEDQLCYIRTDSPYGPFDDVVFYRKTMQSEQYLLGSQQSTVATFGGVGFSDGGHYMWISWAEEGHPIFSFYETEKFLENGPAVQVIALLGVYGFEEFVSFSDAGSVSYTRHNDTVDDCSKEPCVYHLDLHSQPSR